MKIKILVIFFLALILSFIIYNITLNNRKSILILGDNHLVIKHMINTYMMTLKMM